MATKTLTFRHTLIVLLTALSFAVALDVFELLLLKCLNKSIPKGLADKRVIGPKVAHDHFARYTPLTLLPEFVVGFGLRV